jgi:hypothetical protein
VSAAAPAVVPGMQSHGRNQLRRTARPPSDERLGPLCEQDVVRKDVMDEFELALHCDGLPRHVGLRPGVWGLQDCSWSTAQVSLVSILFKRAAARW